MAPASPETTPLQRALRARIAADGPISVEAYMEACNDFYYATRDPLGPGGDFITAPEISQMFGELVGAALADCWKRAGSPTDAVYAELGPGRGTLATDALRVLRSVGFHVPVHFVETSPALRAVQSQAAPGAIHHDSIGDLPAVPLLVVANEFFDALPIRQFVAGTERLVTVVDGALSFDRDGTIVEDSPARTSAMAMLTNRLVSHGGAAIVVDYGHERSAPGDTLQAMRRHGYAGPLDNSGEQDLTSHVDFEALAATAKSVGAIASRVQGQGDWLRALGIAQRAAKLAEANPDREDEIGAAHARLAGEEAMGRLFKVMAVRAPDWPMPAGLAE